MTAEATSTPDETVAEEPKLSSTWSLVIDKAVDFLLVFVGLYAAIAAQRYQEEKQNRKEYVTLLNDFEYELTANNGRHAALEAVVGPLDEQSPRAVLGPMVETFDRYFAELDAEEELASCLHRELLVAAARGVRSPTRCAGIEADRARAAAAFSFEPAKLTPFFRYEVWELYVTSGARVFENKELAVRIGEVYNDLRTIERQVAAVESTYNDTFMRQVGRAAATSVELAHLSDDTRRPAEQDLARLKTVEESLSGDRRAALEAKSILELKVRSIKRALTDTARETDALIAKIDGEIEAKAGE